MWKSSESFLLIDLGSDYYIVKFAIEENMFKALNGGPWFINGSYLSLQRWSPNFVASEARPHITAVWVRLPNLPTEFYDALILQKIGNKIGKLVKTNAFTSTTLRGRYARLCL